MASSRDPPSYHESLRCVVLKCRRVDAAPRHSSAREGDIADSCLPAADTAHDTSSIDTDCHDAFARLSAATEQNAVEFIWYELPKHLKSQWAQSDLRSVLDDCPRYSLTAAGNRIVRLYGDIISGALSLADWRRESGELIASLLQEQESFSAGSAQTGRQSNCSSIDDGARDRISKANEDNAAHFIWAELPKDLKVEWDARLIRSVLDMCQRYSPETAGNRFVRLYDDILRGVFTATLWQQENDELMASLLIDHEESFSADRALAQQLQAEWGRGGAVVSPSGSEEAAAFASGSGRRCKVVGCTESHTRHFCKNCKLRDSDHRSRECPFPASPDAIALPAQAVPVSSDAGAAALSPALSGPPNEMNLFHQTNPESGQKIIREQRFVCSDPSRGKFLAGPGIYFAVSADDTHHKVRNPANKGCILAATVNLGRVLDIPFEGDQSITAETLRARGYDSVRIPRRGNPGTEYVVYNTNQISNIRVHQ